MLTIKQIPSQSNANSLQICVGLTKTMDKNYMRPMYKRQNVKDCCAKKNTQLLNHLSRVMPNDELGWKSSPNTAKSGFRFDSHLHGTTEDLQDGQKDVLHSSVKSRVPRSQ